MLTQLMVIRSHTGVARLLAHCEERPVGYIPRQADIPSPYAYSPTWPVYHHETLGAIVIRETSHKVYRVFRAPEELVMSEQAAEEIGCRA